MALKTVHAYKTEDGTLFEIEQMNPAASMAEALAHDKEWAFRKWCEQNICVGGEWSSRMVADAIIAEWHMEKRDGQ